MQRGCTEEKECKKVLQRRSPVKKMNSTRLMQIYKKCKKEFQIQNWHLQLYAVQQNKKKATYRLERQSDPNQSPIVFLEDEA